MGKSTHCIVNSAACPSALSVVEWSAYETNLRRLTELSRMQNPPMQDAVNRTSQATEKAFAAARVTSRQEVSDAIWMGPIS